MLAETVHITTDHAVDLMHYVSQPILGKKYASGGRY